MPKSIIIKKMGYLSFTLSILILTLLLSSVSYAEYGKKILMKSGDPAPGTNGAVFSSAFSPNVICIADSGKVLFRGYLERDGINVTNETDMGFWVYESDSLRLIARRGSPVPGMPGFLFRKDTQLNLEVNMDRNGQVSLDAFYSTDGTFVDEEHGFFMEENGEMVLKLLAGLEVTTGANIDIFDAGAFNNGRVVFSCLLEGPGVVNTNNRAYCQYGPEGVTVLAREDDPMHLIAGGWVNHDIAQYNDTMPLTADGETIFQIIGSHVDHGIIGASYKWSPDDGFSLLRVSEIGTNRVTTAFGEWRMDSHGYWMSIPLRMWPYEFSVFDHNDDLIVTAGDIAPGTDGATFSSFVNGFAAIDTMQVAFKVAPSDNKRGIWIGNQSYLRKVVQKDDWVPDVTDSIQFGDVKYWMPNAQGQIAVANTMRISLYFTYTAGIWMFNPDESAEPITFRGEVIDVAPGDTRTIWGIYTGVEYSTGMDEFPISSGNDGFPAKLNNAGQLVFSTYFQEGGYAVLIASPGGLVVNHQGDAPDADSTDGICATGNLLPDGRPECTLRAAITEANSQDGYNKITFDIDANNPMIILSTALPDIKDSVTIDGSSQPDDNTVTLLGSLIPDGTHGLVLDGEDITIKGMEIGGFGGSGIFISGLAQHTVGSNKVFGCLIGWKSSMGPSMGNGEHGIHIEQSSNNIIGGAENWQRNLITNNSQNGIWLTGQSTNNAIINNVIGLTADDGNGAFGILIDYLSDSNFVGGGPDSGNVIAGNIDDGVGIIHSDHNSIRGNNICNNLNGVLIRDESYYNSIVKNVIGINELGQAAGNRSFGVQMDLMSDSNIVGGSLDSGNVISANDSGGVLLYDADYTMICGNYIGVDASGSVAMGNHGDGILIDYCEGTIIGDKFIDLHSIIGAGNLISGNDSAGVTVCNRSVGTIINSNLIGVAEDGVAPLSNYWGVRVFDSPQTNIGHGGQFNTGYGNTINANEKTGILLVSDSCSVVSNSISDNGWGLIPLGGDGVYIDGMANLIGAKSLENEMYNNAGVGVMVVDDMTHSNDFNWIQFNKMSTNTEGGIDLAPIGINPIDILDLDDGPNNCQNAPHFVSATFTLNQYLIVRGVLKSKPNQTYHVVVYNSGECFEWLDIPNQGYEWILEDFVTTDATGEALIDISEGPWLLPVPTTLTMHVTDPFGNSSEFSNCAYIWNQPDGVDLAVEKTDHADSMAIDDTLHYEITITNMGSDTATNVILTDSLPATISYIADSSDHGPCQFLDGRLTCNLGTMPPLDVANIRLIAIAGSLGLIENSAVVSANENDVNPTTNIAIDFTISSDSYTDVDDDSNETDNLPYKFELSQNYPNPFNPRTTIEYSLPQRSYVTIEIFNLLGQKVRSLIGRDKSAGSYTITWDGNNSAGAPAATGVYLYRFQAGEHIETKKMLLMK